MRVLGLLRPGIYAVTINDWQISLVLPLGVAARIKCEAGSSMASGVRGAVLRFPTELSDSKRSSLKLRSTHAIPFITRLSVVSEMPQDDAAALGTTR